MTQDEFDSLAIFVAVAEELQREPFFSQDNHDKLSIFPNGSTETVTAFFCHPAFLKSAVLPFRKIWMSSERCAFRNHNGTGGIRDLVFRDYPDHKFADGYRYWYHDSFEQHLTQQADWGQLSNKEIVNIWINTQGAHTGPKDPNNKKSWEFELKDFDQMAAQLGREKFEFLFRSNLQNIGGGYVSFAQKLAVPLYDELRRQGMVPGFEAEVALKYNPYPDQRYRITFDDVFWHLDRESMEETFDRIRGRQCFADLDHFLRGLVPNKAEALAGVCRFDDFEALLRECGAKLLEKEARIEGTLLSRSGPPGFECYDGRVIRFRDNAQEILSHSYQEFRTCLFEDRKRQKVRYSEHEW